MTINSLKKIEVFQTKSIAEDSKDPATLYYVQNCLKAFWCGDWGEIGAEDIESNLEDLKEGCGRVYARYKKAEKLESDLIIETLFNDEITGTDYNYTMICYFSER